MAQTPSTDWKTGALFWWAAVGLPVYFITFYLTLSSQPALAWLILPVYSGGFVMLMVLFIQWRQATTPLPKEFKTWLMLYVLEKFCLGCVLSIAASPLLNKSYLCIIPMLFLGVVYYLRRQVFINWKQARQGST